MQHTTLKKIGFRQWQCLRCGAVDTLKALEAADNCTEPTEDLSAQAAKPDENNNEKEQ